MDDTSTALIENVAPSTDSSDITLVDSAEQVLPDQQVLSEIQVLGTQMNHTVHSRATESNLNTGLDRPGDNYEAYIAPPDNHSPQMDCLALTQFRPVQHNDQDLEHLAINQERQDTLLKDQTDVLEDINKENIRLKIQCDDLLSQRAALEDDLSTSFIENLDLEKRLSRAEKMIEKGKVYHERFDADWKRDIAKLRHMTRLFEANTDNTRYVEMLRQQIILEEQNEWLSGQLEMKTEDNRFFACQREAALRACSYQRSCAMSSEIQQLRQWLSTVQAQLGDTEKARTRLEEELQQERLKHRAVRDASYQNSPELKHTMGSYAYNVQQTAYAGSSAPQRPLKFTTTHPTAFPARFSKAETPPPFTSGRKFESNFGADTFFEAFSASGSVPQRYGTRSKSKFSFGENTVPQSASTTTETPTGATPRTDFDFTFGDIVDTGGSDLASNLSAEARDKVDLSGGLQPKTTTEKMVPWNFAEAADLSVDQKTQNRAQKPVASDFFDDVSVMAEVKKNSMDALAAEKTSEGRVPIAITEADAAPQTHIGGVAAHRTTTEGSVQAGEHNETTEAEQGNNSLLPPPPPTPESAPPAYEEFTKPPKYMGRTQKRNFLRKAAKARKRAEIGGAGGNGTS